LRRKAVVDEGKREIFTDPKVRMISDEYPLFSPAAKPIELSNCVIR
jgi:hypothetical protein